MNDTENPPPRPRPTEAADSVKARFATPIEADLPVNSKVESTKAFSPLPPAEASIPKPQ